MTKTIYTITMPYEFNPTRKGAKYLIGDAYKNHGEFVESVMKHHRGLDYLKNPNTSFSTGSDIESEKMSVKSDSASLGKVYGYSLTEILTKFFENSVSEKYAWGYEKNGVMTEYIMTKKEFFEFCQTFGKLGVESKSKKVNEGFKVRFPTTSVKMLSWFECQVA